MTTDRRGQTAARRKRWTATPQPALVAFGPCPLCGTRARAIPTATAGHRCPKDAGRWIKLEPLNESETAE